MFLCPRFLAALMYRSPSSSSRNARCPSSALVMAIPVFPVYRYNLVLEYLWLSEVVMYLCQHLSFLHFPCFQHYPCHNIQFCVCHYSMLLVLNIRSNLLHLCDNILLSIHSQHHLHSELLKCLSLSMLSRH